VPPELNQPCTCEAGRVPAGLAALRREVHDSPLDRQSSFGVKLKSSRWLCRPNEPAREIGAPLSGDRESDGSRTLFEARLVGDRTPAPSARVREPPHSQVENLARRRWRPRSSRNASLRRTGQVVPKARRSPAYLGTGTSRALTPIQPLIDFGAEPADGSAAEMQPLWKMAEERKRGQCPMMPSRQSRDLMRGQDLIPCRKSLVDPAGERHSIGRNHPRDRPQSRVVDAHDG
jgi:hypothetical protein